MCTDQSLSAAGHSCLQPSFLILCSPKPKISPCHLYWKSDYEILIGWADRVKVRMLLETTRQHIHHTTSIPSHATCVIHTSLPVTRYLCYTHITSCHTLPVLYTHHFCHTLPVLYTTSLLSHAACVTHHFCHTLPVLHTTSVTRCLCYTPLLSHATCVIHTSLLSHATCVIHTPLLSHATCVIHHITSCHTLPVLYTTSLPVTRYLCHTP